MDKVPWISLSIESKQIVEVLEQLSRKIDEDTIGPWLGPQAPKDPSPIKGPITRDMHGRIKMGLPQEDQIHHGPYMLFS